MFILGFYLWVQKICRNNCSMTLFELFLRLFYAEKIGIGRGKLRYSFNMIQRTRVVSSANTLVLYFCRYVFYHCVSRVKFTCGSRNTIISGDSVHGLSHKGGTRGKCIPLVGWGAFFNIISLIIIPQASSLSYSEFF